jgi:hypothetical protein
MMLLFWSYALAFPSSSIEAGPEALGYRADQLSEMQDTLKALADIKARQEIEREQVESGDAQTIKEEAA